MTYASAFRSVGIGTTYAGAFKSAGTSSKNAGIGYIHVFIKAVPTQVKTPEQGLKVPGPIPALLKSTGTSPRDPIPVGNMHIRSRKLNGSTSFTIYNMHYVNFRIQV